MITKNLAKSLEEIGFTYVAGDSSENCHVYAIYGGYMVTVYEKASKKIAYINFRFSESEENNLKKYDISESFSSYIEEYSVSDYSISDDGMRVYCSGSIPVFMKLIDQCITILVDNEIRGTDYCSKCGNKFGSRSPKKVYIENENHIMCEHCALDTLEEIKNTENDDTQETGSVIKAILTSVLLSIVGGALLFVLYYWLSPALAQNNLGDFRYIFCICGFVISLLAYVGYRAFSKKISLSAYITIAVNSILVTSIAQYISIVFEFITKNNFPTSVLKNKSFWLIHLRNTIPADVADQFIDQNYSSMFWKLFFISLMFAAVGAAIFLLTLHDKSKPKQITAQIETISIK